AAKGLASGGAPSRLTRPGGNSEVRVMRAGRLKIVLIATFTSAAVLIAPEVASAAAGLPAGKGAAATGPGSVLWTSTVAGGGQVVAADPKGGTGFVTGSAGLVAYDAGTGKQLWANAAGAGPSVCGG